MKITPKRLITAGFEYEDLGDDSPYEWWTKGGVKVWNFNNQYWLVDALDQGGIHVEFHTMEQLDAFWRACLLPPLVFAPPKPKKPL